MVTAATKPRSTLIREARAKRALIARLARTDVNTFCEFVLKDEKTGEPVRQGGPHERWHHLADQHDRLLLWSHIESGKAVPLTTPIPTPRGWRTMGSLQVGDEVFDRHGAPAAVKWVSPVMHERRLFRVVFDDGGAALADEDHQWVAWPATYPIGHKWPLVTTTAELRRGWRIPIAGPVQYPPAVLPEPPEVVGRRLAASTSDQRVPDAYLTAADPQRRALLAGLLERDVARPIPRRAALRCSGVGLAGDVAELARSLGYKVTVRAARRVRVRMVMHEGRARYRRVVGIEPVPTQPVRCIAVAGDETYLMGRDYTVTHNTAQMSVGRTLFEMGRDPNLRYLILSNTAAQATKVARVIRTYVESSDELHEVFPDLQPGAPWGDTAFSVARSVFSKDPTVQISGVHGNVLGARLDRVVMDDVLDYENTATEDNRKGLIDWVLSTIVGRLVGGSRVRCIGTAFHPHDLLHHLAKSGYAAFRYPVVDEAGHPRWKERWSLERIAAKALELGPVEAARQLMCEARDDTTARFKREWIEVALRLGNGTSLASALQVVPPGYRTFTGVDLAVQRKDAAGETCLFDIAVDPYGNRSVLSIEAGKWGGPEIVAKITNHHQRYQSVCVVENNAAQDFIVQFTRAGAAVPIIPFTTGRNKAHPEFGIESLAAEFAGGKWRIPNHNGVMHPEVAKWVDEMLFYNPKAHTGDRLMASWFAREGVRLGSRAIENAPDVDLNRR